MKLKIGINGLNELSGVFTKEKRRKKMCILRMEGSEHQLHWIPRKSFPDALSC